MKRENIERAARLNEELEDVEEALKASSVEFIIPDLCGISKVKLKGKAMRVVKDALKTYADKLRSEIENF
ncbi:hypothetical protein [Porphyromonas loveana]|uniref:hypothetical protein n=1 Tax=Porphyromonas loveana TaxID=1884669 RepID=UPI0035A09EE5